MLTHIPQPNLQLAFWAGLLVIGVSLLTLVAIILIRFVQLARKRRSKKFLKLWRPLLMQSMTEIPQVLPRVLRRDAMDFFRLWNHYQESLRGESRKRLRQVAYQVGMDRIALQMLRGKSVRKRLMGIVTLGYMGEKKAWKDMKQATESKNVLLSITAARALLYIDTAAAIPVLMPHVIGRADWPLILVRNLLKEAGADLISRPLAEAIKQAPPSSLPRIIRYLDTTHRQESERAIRQILKETEDPEAIAACIRFLKDSTDLNLVRTFANRKAWPIRLHVAKALGRMGTQEDIPHLVKFLSDPEWWVRYRAAQALVRLPSLDKDELLAIQATQKSALASEVILQALAEEGLS